jgi:hypothetical protein
MANPYLGGVRYDPATLATASVAAAAVMANLDATNLGAAFTTPASRSLPADGVVIIRGGVCHQQQATPAAFPRVLLGALDNSGGAVKARMSPVGGINTGTLHQGDLAGLEFYALVSGLATNTAFTYNLGWGVEVTDAHSQLAWGGPDDASGDDACGAAWMEIVDPGSRFLGGTVYDPSTAGALTLTADTAMADCDATNLALTITAPASQNIWWRARVVYTGASSTVGSCLLGIREGSSLVGGTRQGPRRSIAESMLASSATVLEASGFITGISAGSHTYKLAAGTQLAASAGGALKWGGPNNTTANDAWGGALFEIWAA